MKNLKYLIVYIINNLRGQFLIISSFSALILALELSLIFLTSKIIQSPELASTSGWMIGLFLSLPLLAVTLYKQHLIFCVKFAENFVTHFSLSVAKNEPLRGGKESDTQLIELALQKAVRVSEGLIIPFLSAFPKIILFIVGAIWVFFLLPLTAIFLISGAVGISIMFIFLQARTAENYSHEVAARKEKKFNLLLSIFCGRRRFLLQGGRRNLEESLLHTDQKYSFYRGSNQFRTIIPRVIAESALPLFIVAAAVMSPLLTLDEATTSIPLVIVIRLIPIGMQAYGVLMSIKGDWQAFLDIAQKLKRLDSPHTAVHSQDANGLSAVEKTLTIKRSDVELATIACGENLLIIGASGVGKSTLLDAIAGFRILNDFSIEYNWSASDMTYIEQSVDRRCFPNGLVVTEKNADLFERLTSALDLDLKAQGSGFDQGSEILIPVERVQTLSGGEWQRLVLAYEIAHAESLVLADEPLSAVNEEYGVLYINRILEILKSQCISMVIVAHLSPTAVSQIKNVKVLNL